MKQLVHIFIISLFFSILALSSTAQITDNFSDGDFTINPQWKGKLTDFIVNDSYQLQLNATQAGDSHMFLPIALEEATEWSFFIRQKFSPSSNNYAQIYLLADDSSLINSEQAIYLQFGESGSNDVVELVKQIGSEKTILIRGKTSIASSFELNVKVRRSVSGQWSLFLKTLDSNLYTEEGSIQDDFMQSPSVFGIYCKYTSSNKQRFYFDNFYIGPPRIDTKAPSLLFFDLISSDSLLLEFSESLDTSSILNPHNYSINNGTYYPEKIFFDSEWKSVTLAFNRAFDQNKKSNLKIRGLKDLSKNLLKDTLITFTYYQLDTADLVINEILFDPLNGGEEYVEIYNRSEKHLRLDKLKFLRIKEDFPNPPDTTIINITNEPIVINPQEYWIVSKAPEKVVQQFYAENPDYIIKNIHFPSLLNDEGILGLLSSEALLIDKVYYNQKMHHPLLNFTDGVSLERIHYDRSGYDISNWHSSASNNGFGTPTYKNSQFNEFDISSELISLSSKTFSPDNDGFEDLLTINYSLAESASIANVIIFDGSGQQIKYLLNNEYLGTQGAIVWNGTDDQNQISPVGIYIIYIELLELNGKLKKIKKTVVLSKQLK